MQPRIALYGNVANSLFRISRVLRDSGMDVDLLLDSGAPATASPRQAEHAVPVEWVVEDDWITPAAVVSPQRAGLTRRLSEYDFALVAGAGPAFAHLSGIPWGFLATGGDLTIRPFARRAFQTNVGARSRLGAVALSAWQRRGIRRAPIVFTQPFAPFVSALESLGVEPSRISQKHFPFVVDVDRFAPSDCPSQPRSDADLVIFHPSRLMVRDDKVRRASGQWKGNDVLLRGLAEAREETGADIVVRLIDSPASPDTELVRSLIDELGIGDAVEWLRPPSGYLDASAMIAQYQAADVIADDFGAGWFGFVVLEGLSMARPALCHVDEGVMGRLYGAHPILTGNTPESVATHLGQLLDESHREAVGRSGRDWILRHHSPAAASDAYRSAMTEALRVTGVLR